MSRRHASRAALAGLGVAAGVGLIATVPGHAPAAGSQTEAEQQALGHGIVPRPGPAPVVWSQSPERASRSDQRQPLTRQVTHQVTRSEPVAPPFSGMASWYGPGFEGQRTASGAIYDSSLLTAASKTLPLGTHLQVCSSGCVTVLVNDRGPYVGDRVLDLSRAAAADIGLLSAGVGYVTATPVDTRVVAASVTEAVVLPAPPADPPAPVRYRNPDAAGE